MVKRVEGRVPDQVSKGPLASHLPLSMEGADGIDKRFTISLQFSTLHHPVLGITQPDFSGHIQLCKKGMTHNLIAVFPAAAWSLGHLRRDPTPHVVKESPARLKQRQQAIKFGY